MALSELDRAVRSVNARRERRRRRHTRYRDAFRVKVTHLVGNTYHTTEGHCRDLSEGGIGLLLATDLEGGDVVILNFTLPESGEAWEMSGVVRHRRGYHYGLEFLTIVEAQKVALRAHFAGLTPID